MLSLRSVVETGHPRLGTTVCDSSEAIIVNGNSGSDFIFFEGGRSFQTEIENQFPSTSVNITKNTVPGSGIDWRWTNDTLAKTNVQNYSTLIITHISGLNVGTNTVPLFLEYCDLWVNHYWQNANNGNGAGKVWLLGTQARLDIPDYIGNVRFRHEMWSKAQDQSNIKRPNDCPRVQIIPVYFAYQKIYEDQESGLTPTSTFFDDLYIDPFHGGSTARYVHLVMHMACVFGIDPRSVTPIPLRIDDGGFPALTITESEYIRQVCYDVMHWTERHGVDVTAWDN